MRAGDTACAAIAEKQSGLISREQAIRTGMSEQLISDHAALGGANAPSAVTLAYDL